MYSQTLVAPTLRVSSPLSPRSVPSICISPAADVSTHPDTPALEPSSPEDVLSPRSTYLLPPPVGSPLGRTHSQKTTDKKGLDPSTFQELLAANRERAAKRSVSIADRLRREVVVKAHHNKQVERRALFLSRITAPPSPTSAETAVTPPETPAIFHFSLPSPGLASPLELFETVTSHERWVEQVDYKKPQRTPVRDVFPGRLPSLDQITARLRAKTTEVPAIPAIVVDAPEPVSVKPLTIVKGDRIDEVKPRSRLPASIIASTRARAASPPTPFPTEAAFAAIPVVSNTPSKLIISSSPPKSIKPVLVPQSIPALRINKTQAELAPVPVMSWRERPAAVAPTRPHMAESWRQEVPVKKEPVRETVVTPITPRLVMQPPIGVKPAPPIPRETRPKVMTRRPEPLPIRPVAPTHTRTRSAEGVLKMDATGVVNGIAVSRRSAMLRVQKEVASALKLTESERRAVQGRNMVDKLRRRISAPAELQGAMKKGAPVGGF